MRGYQGSGVLVSDGQQLKKGLKVNTGKTEVMASSRRGTKVNIKDSQSTSLRQVKKN